MRRSLAIALLLAAGACKDDPPGEPTPTPDAAKAETPPAENPPAGTSPSDEASHHVAFFDRASHAYLLLVGRDQATEPTREELVALVRAKIGEGGEADKLVELVELPPVASAMTGTDAKEQERIRKLDLLGLAIDVLDVGGDDSVIEAAHLTDPVLTRALDDPQRATLPGRRHAIMLRAEYRNRDAVRGLRLLQTLTRLLAEQRGALIHDADTHETMDVEAFAARQLRAGEGNVAEQLAIVPFPDPRHGEGFARLTTRGMRRFGSVELELDGLPADPHALDRASHLLAGLAYRMVREGEYDVTGFAVEVPETLDVSIDDVTRAYAGQKVAVPKCEQCPRHVAVHLVARPRQPHDPVEQIVARVVAPRADGTPDREHPAWARSAVEDLFGPLP